jgi:two-component system, OmpR family, alkaline phosphatase synthesis response regulator PhoP
MATKTRILLVGDESEIRHALADRSFDDREFVFASDGETALRRASRESFDLIALDFQAPTPKRLETFRTFQSGAVSTPVLLWTTRQQLMAGLGSPSALEKEPEKAPVYEFSNVRVDCNADRVTRAGSPIFVSAREMQLLKYFIRRRGQAVSRGELLTDVWGFDPRMRTRTIDVHLAWIRQKLEPQPRQPEYFLTIRGLGYRFAG